MADSLRLLSIAHPLRNPLVDNHSIFNAPSLFDYEAISIDVGGVFDSIRQVVEGEVEHRTRSGLPIVNGESSAAATGLADLLKRRQDELQRALERGAVVTVFLHPQATLPQVSGFSGLDRYFLLPAPAGMSWDSRAVRGGEGTSAAVTDHGHPFAPVIDVLRGDLLYRAYLDDRAPGFAGHAHVIARSPGGGVVSAAFDVASGEVVFLPTPRTAGSNLSAALASAILDAMRGVLGDPRATPPAWIGGIEVAGLAEREQNAAEAREALERAQQALDAAEHARAELARVRDVLWVEGDSALMPAALRCLELLGFEPAGDQRLQAPEGELYVEAHAIDGPVGMVPHYRLRSRIDAVIAEEGRAPRGLVVASGQRLVAPADRDEPFSSSLRVAAEATGYALITSTALFEAASAVLAGNLDTDAASTLRARLLGTDGLVDVGDLLGETPTG
ncbi:MAG: hypothetical protein R3C39_00820 [Dehalococcoidia bacterium]